MSAISPRWRACGTGRDIVLAAGVSASRRPPRSMTVHEAMRSPHFLDPGTRERARARVAVCLRREAAGRDQAGNVAYESSIHLGLEQPRAPDTDEVSIALHELTDRRALDVLCDRAQAATTRSERGARSSLVLVPSCSIRSRARQLSEPV